MDVVPIRSASPAALGGAALFPEGLPLARPQVDDPDAVGRAVAKILAGGLLTNGPTVRALEERAADYLGVSRCVAVSSCTAGLMLVLRAAELSGDVVLPSFTFAATAHAVAWNGLEPRFADIEPATLTLWPASAAHAVGVRTSAILATHLYGTPCDVEGLTAVARRNGIRLFFDAAHAFGSTHDGQHVGGFGDAEVFSLSPTKPLVAAEGGIIATNDDVLAERCRIGRDYANPGDYDCRFVGMNARMSELHAAVALASFDGLEERILVRNELAVVYREAMAEIPGISFPAVPAGDRSTFKDLTILVEPDAFGMSASALADALRAEGIETRRYYAPPVHRMRAYRAVTVGNGGLPVTERASERVLSLPLWEGLTPRQVQLVGFAVERLRRVSPGRRTGQELR
jgi:dTDP-4-amino-4,6-dideoxygalactose transaminase